MLLVSWIDFCFPYISYAHLFLFLCTILSIWDFLFLFLPYTLAFMVAQMGKNSIQETQVQSLDWEDSSREGNGNPLQYSCLENPRDRGTWRAAVHGVTKSQTQLSDFTFTFHFHALEKAMATHSIVLAWRIPGTGEPGGLQSMGSHRVGHDWSDLAAAA